jgi:hypothetical protein
MANDSVLLPASVSTFSTKQRMFVRYFTAILIDLVVLNLFVEYSKHVEIDSFTISLLAALLLQVLLKLTMALEHRIAAYFNAKQGGFARFMRFLSAWLVLFGSKFVILEATAADLLARHDHLARDLLPTFATSAHGRGSRQVLQHVA